MHKPRGITRLSATAAIVGTMFVAMAPCARATPVQIGFNGGGASGHASLTVGPDATAGDPAGAQLIGNASGTFSDGNLGITDALITGVVARNFATPTNPADIGLLPTSFSYIPSVGGVNQGIGASYDELFYPDGSPVVCNPDEYPFSGGFLDIFGVMFSLDNGDAVNLFSWGVIPGGPSLNFGLTVLTGSDSIGWSPIDASYDVRAAVPEPNMLWLFGAGLLGLLAWRRPTQRSSLRGT